MTDKDIFNTIVERTITSYNDTGRIITKIGSYAFRECENLSRVVLPVCSQIYKDAFKNCSSNLLVKIGASNCALQASNIFPNTTIIALPIDYISSYRTSTYWSTIKDNTIPDAIPLSLSLNGELPSNQYSGFPPIFGDTNFIANYGEKNITISPTLVSYSPSTWQDTGTQTMSFSFTYENTTVSCSASATVTAINVDSTLNNNSWDTIKLVASLNLASNYWSLGDYKNVTLSAYTSFSYYKLAAGTYRARIIGINHNADLEGYGLIHFAIDHNGTKYISFGTSSGGFYYKGDSTTGWLNSTLRTDIRKFENAFPSDLKNALSKVIKYSNVSTNQNASSISALEERVFVPSFVETGCSYSGTFNPYEADYQLKYSTQLNHSCDNIPSNSTTPTTSTKCWITRSVQGTDSEPNKFQYFVVMNTGIGGSYYPAIPCFCVGEYSATQK